ncbi:MAG: DNA internalization-related competence protein ComEC/Rec2, partial [Polyangiales bacterium]
MGPTWAAWLSLRGGLGSARVLAWLGAGMTGVAAAPALPDVGPMHPGLYRLEARVQRRQVTATPVQAQVVVLRGTALFSAHRLPVGLRLSVRGLDVAPQTRVVALVAVRPQQGFRILTPQSEWNAHGQRLAMARLADAGSVRVVLPSVFWRRLGAARLAVAARLRAHLGPQAWPLAAALLLGESRQVPRAARAQVQAAGLAHLLAVSGLHVGLMLGVWLSVCQRALRFVPSLAQRALVPRLAALCALPACFLVPLFAGGQPSAWRAGLTTALALSLRICGKQARADGVCALAMWSMAGLDPTLAVRPAFLLSVAATAALVSRATAPVRPGPRLLRALRTGAHSALRTFIATAPLTWWFFHSAPLVALLSNLFLLPLLTLTLLPSFLLHAALVCACPPWAPATAWLCALMTRFFYVCCALSSAWSWGQVLAPPSVGQALVAMVGAVLFLATRGARAWLLLAATLLGLACQEQALTPVRRAHPGAAAPLRLTFVDVGQGDATLVELPDGRSMLVDTGGALFGGPDPGARALLPLLRARRRRRLDVVVITHAHPDHYGGLKAVSEAFAIDQLWLNGQGLAEAPHSAWARQVQALRRRGTRVLTAQQLCAQPRWEHGGTQLKVLWPCPQHDFTLDYNDNSLVLSLAYAGRRILVLQLQHGARRVLLTGDIEAEAEAELLRRGVMSPVDVLKVGHHGSRTSSTAPWTATLRPKLAVISCGRANAFGHPAGSVTRRLQQAGARVLVTADVGSV